MARELSRSKYCHFQIQCECPAGSAFLLLNILVWLLAISKSLRSARLYDLPSLSRSLALGLVGQQG